MDKYSFNLKSFRAVKSADIDLNGITVLAGENGCGKSTLTRTLFYVVDVLAHYDEYVFEDYISHMRSVFNRFDIVRREISMFFKDADWTSVQKMQHGLRLSEYTIDNADEIMLLYRDAVFFYARILDDYFKQYSSHNRMGRLMMFIDLDPNKPFDSNEFIDTYILRAQHFYDVFQDKIHHRDIDTFFELINDKYDVRLSPDKVQFLENNVRLLGGKQVGHLFNIEHAIYVDTPMALSNNVINNPLWDQFNSLITNKRQTEWTLPEKKMKARIQHVMHGSLKISDELFEDDLHYIREDNLDIPIAQAATGLKSFAYILRLLENGLLNESTLLIIDEPEAHLHPQWIVEFARVLVLLNTELGVKVLVASHNPDMVAALQAIARKNNSLEQVTYYQANEDGYFSYKYKKLGSEIGEIFKSFNIALERIQYYGAETSNNQ